MRRCYICTSIWAGRQRCSCLTFTSCCSCRYVYTKIDWNAESMSWTGGYIIRNLLDRIDYIETPGSTILDEQHMQIMNSERTNRLDELVLSGWKSERIDYLCARGSNQAAAVESSHPTRHGQTHKTTRGGGKKNPQTKKREKHKKVVADACLRGLRTWHAPIRGSSTQISPIKNMVFNLVGAISTYLRSKPFCLFYL